MNYIWKFFAFCDNLAEPFRFITAMLLASNLLAVFILPESKVVKLIGLGVLVVFLALRITWVVFQKEKFEPGKS